MDDAARTVTFRHTRPDGEFLAKLATPPAFPVPDGVPMTRPVSGAFPGTGPYTIGMATESDVRIVRNPRFRSVDPRVRPDGLPDEIHFTITGTDTSAQERVGMVLDGEADYTPLRGPYRPPPDILEDLGRRHPGLVHPGQAILTYVALDASRPPFDDPGVRQALNLAIDRGRLVEAQGGALVFAPTCQLLPPGWPGYRPYCPWTANPDAGGQWTAPDLAAARTLVDASGTAGLTITVGPVPTRQSAAQEEVVAALRALGYEVDVVPPSDTAWIEALQGGELIAVTVFDYIQLILAPSTYFDGFTCYDPRRHCDRELAEQIEAARALQVTDPAAAVGAWAEIDRAVVDAAFMVPPYNSGADLVSARVGNVQFHPQYLVLLGQLWVQ